jgi:hypothetical protein
MAILVLAPTLKTPSGHDHAFCTELIWYAGASNIRVLASETFQPEQWFCIRKPALFGLIIDHPAAI